jgi:hypothetical protein
VEINDPTPMVVSNARMALNQTMLPRMEARRRYLAGRAAISLSTSALAKVSAVVGAISELVPSRAVTMPCGAVVPLPVVNAASSWSSLARVIMANTSASIDAQSSDSSEKGTKTLPLKVGIWS